MNLAKRVSQSIRPVSNQVANYPDVLGFMTGGKRVNVEVLQVAAATRPAAINAGKPFDAILLLQNRSNADVDAVIQLLIPDKDLAGAKGRFSTKMLKPIRIGLRPGEVGVANFPILSTVQAAAGQGYRLFVDIQVEQKHRNEGLVRDDQGGPTFSLDDLSDDRQQPIVELQELKFTDEGQVNGNKARLVARFEMLPPAISGLPQDLKPDYKSLWGMADNPDEKMLVDKAKSLTAVIVPQLRHDKVFIPLMKALQSYFERAGCRLWAGEAVAIAKLMSVVLENGLPKTSAAGEPPHYPRWYIKLCRVMLKTPRAGSEFETLLTELLFPDLLFDAGMLGYAMVSNVTNKQAGSQEELASHLNLLISALMGQGAKLTASQFYHPLVLGGIICNSRVSMPNEQVRDTANLMATAREKRAGEITPATKPIFDMADDLIERALEHF